MNRDHHRGLRRIAALAFFRDYSPKVVASLSAIRTCPSLLETASANRRDMVISPELLRQIFVAVNRASAAFHARFRRETLRRLLECSEASQFPRHCVSCPYKSPPFYEGGGCSKGMPLLPTEINRCSFVPLIRQRLWPRLACSDFGDFSLGKRALLSTDDHIVPILTPKPTWHLGCSV